MRISIAAALIVTLAPAVGSHAIAADDMGGLLAQGRFTPQQNQAALALVERARNGGLPAPAVVNRIREGIARQAAPEVILTVVRDRVTDLERADAVVQSCAQQGIAIRDRDRSVEKMADAFTQGVKPGDVAGLIPSAKKGAGGLETIAGGAEVMGRLDRKGFAPNDTRDIVAAAIAAGWSPSKMDKLVALRVEADALHLSPKQTRDLLVDGILDKKDDPQLRDAMHEAKPQRAESQQEAKQQHQQGETHHDSGHSGKGSDGHGGRSSGGGSHGGKQGGGGHGGSGHGGGGGHGGTHGQGRGRR